MWRVVLSFLLVLLQGQRGLVTAQSTKPSHWKTLSGSAPSIIAKGGFSGVLPDSSDGAYVFATQVSSPDTILWCDVQLTNDGVGFCLPSIKLDNCTNIANFYSKRKKVYPVNGVPTSGWFSVDFNSTELAPVLLIRSIFSRSPKFDYSYLVLPLEAVQQLAPSIWLNIEHDIFFSQHNLSMRDYVLSKTKTIALNHLSSPEVGFLRGIAPDFQKSKTKLIFRFLEKDVTEPSTNQTYGSLLKNLTFIKTFASGILVPKNYIWPVTSDLYLLPSTSIVMDAHKEGLEIYAGGFANDAVISYNYSYSPLTEQLYFVDNGAFCVDGVVSDFPITPSEAIGCFSHLNKSATDHGRPIIISHNGASGDYPDCTDLAYQKATDEGADFIDCPVQMTREGIPICMSSINLMDDTTVTKSPFSSRVSIIPELKSGPGIFTFDLTWDEIQKGLKPMISNPQIAYSLVRNPRYKNAGRFMSLSDFLMFAKNKALSGVLISVEYAEFMADKLGYDMVDIVSSALNRTGYNDHSSLGVTILSTNSAVLVKFKHQTKYNIMYKIDESIGNADAASIEDIKKFADSVAINKESVYPSNQAFITGQTQLVSTLQAGGLMVYVYGFQNEFTSQAWDYFSDPIVEINSFVDGAGIDGVITDYPGTAKAYKINACRKMGDNAPAFMSAVPPGGLVQQMNKFSQPPAEAPSPVLDPSDVVEPPLPPGVKPSAPAPLNNGSNSSPPASQPSRGSQCVVTSLCTALMTALLGLLLLI